VAAVIDDGRKVVDLGDDVDSAVWSELRRTTWTAVHRRFVRQQPGDAHRRDQSRRAVSIVHPRSRPCSRAGDWIAFGTLLH
jgi:hypothetical protein